MSQPYGGDQVAAFQGGLFGREIAIAVDARAKGRTAEEAARLVGWSRATLYRHQQAHAGREDSGM